MESSQPHDSNAVRVDACRRHSTVVEPCKWHFCQSAGEIDWVSPSQILKSPWILVLGTMPCTHCHITDLHNTLVGVVLVFLPFRAALLFLINFGARFMY